MTRRPRAERERQLLSANSLRVRPFWVGTPRHERSFSHAVEVKAAQKMVGWRPQLLCSRNALDQKVGCRRLASNSHWLHKLGSSCLIPCVLLINTATNPSLIITSSSTPLGPPKPIRSFTGPPTVLSQAKGLNTGVSTVAQSATFVFRIFFIYYVICRRTLTTGKGLESFFNENIKTEHSALLISALIGPWVV